ncbi:MAG TPA: symmetrical bis(5'-nucleosyl)-tetraphosphatase [Casimicrobiaceae bacterium]|nr:symmetrical bis(5'-nucleosyl)-tetraphosphatase [Casimicrobiaceae bacterium]
MRYAIGDIQGCHAEFCRLLEAVAFDARADQLWLVGDLVNRGPDSLAILREVRALGSAAVTVLGNHDLHLATVATGHRKPHRDDTIDAILAAPDRRALIDWLIAQPLVVHDGDELLVHAGVLPSWTPPQAYALSREVQQKLTSDDGGRFLSVLYGDEPRQWRDDLEGDDRLRAIVNACTRLRFCTAEDRMEFREKRGAAFAPHGFKAWFEHTRRASEGTLIVCGHWSTLGLTLSADVAMIDTGCVWGGPLTALQLPDRRVVQVPSQQRKHPAPFG